MIAVYVFVFEKNICNVKQNGTDLIYKDIVHKVYDII